MRVMVNGAPRELEEFATVDAAVAASGAEAPERGVAVAVDGEVVPRAEWDRRRLSEDQRVEVLRAVQGGA